MNNHRAIALDLNLSIEDRNNMMAQYIAKHIDEFPEWYMPINLGPHKIPARTYPSFKPRPESLLDDTCGQRKWDFIIKKNLPDLKGKTVCDIGCNAGIFSIGMAQLGAARVDGFDRGPDIVQPNNHYLGKQSVPQQAYFVRNLYEAYYNERYLHVNFYEADLATIDFNLFHYYDVFVACCVLYHLGAERMETIIRDISEHIPEVFLQANEGHGGELGQLSCLDNHVHLLKKYGYVIKRIDNPSGYVHPVVYAQKSV